MVEKNVLCTVLQCYSHFFLTEMGGAIGQILLLMKSSSCVILDCHQLFGFYKGLVSYSFSYSFVDGGLRYCLNFTSLKAVLMNISK